MPLELGNINLGQLVQAATMPPAIQFMQGLAQLPDTFAKAEYDAGQAQKSRLDAQSLKMQIAKNQWDQTVAMIQKNPDLASSQSIIHKMQALTTDTGYTLPLTKGGTSIDQSVWGADFNEFMKDKDFQERWWASNERGRRAMAAAMHLTGVNKEAFTAEPILTAGEQVLQGKLKVAVSSEKRLENLAGSQIGLNTAKAAGIRANIVYHQGLLADARQKLNERVWEIKFKGAELEKLASKANLTKVEIAKIGAIQRELTGLDRDATAAVDNVDKTLGAAWDAGVDDSELTGLQSDRDAFNQTLTTIGSANSAYLRSLGTRVNESHGRAVSGQSNKSATVDNVAPPPQGYYPPPGSIPTATGPNGRIYWNGSQWVPY